VKYNADRIRLLDKEVREKIINLRREWMKLMRKYDKQQNANMANRQYYGTLKHKDKKVLREMIKLLDNNTI